MLAGKSSYHVGCWERVQMIIECCDCDRADANPPQTQTHELTWRPPCIPPHVVCPVISDLISSNLI